MKNKKFYDLYMDFDKLRSNGIYPCDIDMLYKCKDDYLIIGEAKLKGYHIKGLQEQVLTNIVDGHKQGGVVMEIEHTERVQDGADSVNIADCLVRRAYFEKRWHVYDKPLSVLQWLKGLREKHEYDGAISS